MMVANGLFALDGCSKEGEASEQELSIANKERKNSRIIGPKTQRRLFTTRVTQTCPEHKQG